ncbi:MAG: S16 family serine protease [Candidatus Nanohalobium sp.]
MKRSYVAALLMVAVLAFSLGTLYPDSSSDGLKSMEGSGSATAKIVAASKNSNTGAIGQVKVEIIPGDGDVLVETNPFIQTDTQVSATKAKEVAEEVVGKSLENHDVIYTIRMDSTVVGGPSAGAAMTLATIAAMTDKEIRQEAVITGTITESGRIGKVGKIPVKAYAAGKAGIEDFYVPEGQSVKVNYEKVVERETDGFFVYRDVEYRPRKFNISAYTMRNFGMKTEEVGSIYQAMEKMLK